MKPLLVIKAESLQDACNQLHDRIYDAGGNVHQFAEHMGLHEANYSSWLHGDSDLRVSTFIRLQKMVNQYISEITS